MCPRCVCHLSTRVFILAVTVSNAQYSIQSPCHMCLKVRVICVSNVCSICVWDPRCVTHSSLNLHTVGSCLYILSVAAGTLGVS